MNWCKDVGDWIRTNVEEPLARFFQSLYQSCTDASHWLETITQRVEQQCREQECNWWCLCCNKWFCWLLTVLLSVLTWIVDIVCKLLVFILVVLITILVQLLKWIVLTVVCLLSATCLLLFLLAGIALVAVLLCLVVMASPAFAPIAIPILPIAGTVLVVTLVLVKLLCEVGRCRLLGILAWGMKWSIAIGAAFAVITLSALSLWVVGVIGGCLAALMQLMERLGCAVPKMFGVP